MKQLNEYQNLSNEEQVKLRSLYLLSGRNMEDEIYNIANWVVDDCALFEPTHAEMVDIFGEEYEEIIFKNTRKGFTLYGFYLDRASKILYADLSIRVESALEISEDNLLKWAGIESLPYRGIAEPFGTFKCGIAIFFDGPEHDPLEKFRVTASVVEGGSIFKGLEEMKGNTPELDPAGSFWIEVMEKTNQKFEDLLVSSAKRIFESAIFYLKEDENIDETLEKYLYDECLNRYEVKPW